MKPPPFVIIMGVSGAGKTTLGRALAHQLKVAFFDADDLHSVENREKMAAGIPLTDADRKPWLGQLRELVTRQLDQGAGGVLACSLLKERYRKRVGATRSDVRLVFLHGAREILKQRLRARQGHFVSEQLLDSQLATLEPPAGAIEIDVELSTREQLEEVVAALSG